MLVIQGSLRLEARDRGRALLVIKTATGQETAIERSADQLRQLRYDIDQHLARAQADADAAAEAAAAEVAQRLAAAEKAQVEAAKAAATADADGAEAGDAATGETAV